jgi:deazaflavin-dependent oxidoreductase (nitroreductase family)
MRLAGSSVANWYTKLNVWVYEASQGRTWSHLQVPETGEPIPILLLRTIGRRSGKARVVPLIYIELERAFVVAAANAGHRQDPAWYLNLRANPAVSISLGSSWSSATARITTGAEREELRSEFAAVYPPLLRYERATSREIPIVVLEPRAMIQPPQ